MSLYIDLTEFLDKPITTGIQRVAGELCKHLPPGTAIPVRLHSRRYTAFSPDLIQTIGLHFTNPSESGVAELRRLAAIERGSAIQISQHDTVLVPELFIDPRRIAFFRDMTQSEFERYRFIVYDLIPITHPEYFPSEWPLQTYGYFQIIRRAFCCGFISQHTREAYYGRLRRTSARGGVVLPLGSDSLGPRPVQPALDHPPTFTVVGNIEPRKHHELVLEAFEPLLHKINGLKLLFVGKMDHDSEFTRKLRGLAANKSSGFEFHASADDAKLRSYLERSRATIYVSDAEGYGLPPVESLWVGTPVIASRTIPSLQAVGAAGVHYVEPLNPVNLRGAVLAFLDNAYANRKTEETLQLNLPTWAAFTREVRHWWGNDGG
ncbi:MAG TPA: glycosyltransferase [Bryobacteraceae bacterium]